MYVSIIYPKLRFKQQSLVLSSKLMSTAILLHSVNIQYKSALKL